MDIRDWRKAWDEKMKKMAELGRKRTEQSKAPMVITDSFPSDIVGQVDLQTGIRLESRSQYRRELEKRGMVTVSPSEGERYE